MENSGNIPEVAIRRWYPAVDDTDPVIRRSAAAVRDYDETLRLFRNEDTGNWVVGIGERGHPVLDVSDVFGNVEDIGRKLTKFDTKRHGDRIMAELGREAQIKADDAKYRTDETHSELAEHFWSARKRLKGEQGSIRGRTPYLGGVKRGKGFE